MEKEEISRKRRMVSLVILGLLLLFCLYLVHMVSPYMLDVVGKLLGGGGESTLRVVLVGIAFVTPLMWSVICFLTIVEEAKSLKEST